MSWTDERVQRLTKLWQDGLSASKIAAELGGVTRNAVIGKVHRLGMSNRDKKGATEAAAAAASAPANMAERGAGAADAPVRIGTGAPSRASQPSGRTRQQSVGTGGSSATYSSTQRTAATMGNAALKMDMETDAEEETVVEAKVVEKNAEDVVVPISRKLTLLQLSESTCKWPTGDPTMPGFSFCGHSSAEDKPYCDYHAKIAFQPPNERRRRR